MSCIRCAAKLLTKSAATDGIVSLPSPLLQSVRGIKPRWLPKSKSKIFYVRTPTPIDPVEHEQLKTLYAHYRAQLRSIRSFICAEHGKLPQDQKQQTIEQEDKAAMFMKMEQEVRQWNAKIQVVREENQAQEAEWEKQRVERNLAKKEGYRRLRLEKVQQRLQKEMEEASNFISMENLDTEIEKLLNMRSDYNFAIDKQGNKFSIEAADTNNKRSETAQQAEAAAKG